MIKMLEPMMVKSSRGDHHQASLERVPRASYRGSRIQIDVARPASPPHRDDSGGHLELAQLDEFDASQANFDYASAALGSFESGENLFRVVGGRRIKIRLRGVETPSSCASFECPPERRVWRLVAERHRFGMRLHDSCRGNAFETRLVMIPSCWISPSSVQAFLS